MKELDFSNRKNMSDVKWFLFQVLNFDEHGKNSYLTARGKLY